MLTVQAPQQRRGGQGCVARMSHIPQCAGSASLLWGCTCCGCLEQALWSVISTTRIDTYSDSLAHPPSVSRPQC